MLQYQKIDLSEGIDVNKTSSSINKKRFFNDLSNCNVLK